MTAARTKRTSNARKAKARRDWRPAFLEGLAVHGTVKRACMAANIGRSTAYDERQRNEEFALAWHDVENDVTDKLEDKAVALALAGEVKLLEFLLKARRPERYRDSVKVEHSGRVEHDVREMTEAELTELAAGLDARRAGAR